MESTIVRFGPSSQTWASPAFESHDYNQMREQLWHVIVGTNAGKKRARIIQALDHRPRSTSQLAERLDEHYNTIRYHLEILHEENIVKPSGNEYGEVYFLTDAFEQHSEEFEEIVDHLDLEG